MFGCHYASTLVCHIYFSVLILICYFQQKLKEADGDLYSLLISAYGHSKEGGFLSQRLKEYVRGILTNMVNTCYC